MGRVRIMLSGGAPLSPTTHSYLRDVLGVDLLQGYGLTETCACGSVNEFEELSAGNVGPPVGCIHIRLVNWEEGNYRVTDTPYPRGEVYIGGDNVAWGYFKQPGKTVEDVGSRLEILERLMMRELSKLWIVKRILQSYNL